MNDYTDGNRRPPRAGAITAVAAAGLMAAGLLGAGCANVLPAPHAATSGRRAYPAELAFSRCMRAHGEPKFPLPARGAVFHLSGHPPQGNAASPAARATAACRHLLPPGSTSPGS